jgi:hypothetical protein
MLTDFPDEVESLAFLVDLMPQGTTQAKWPFTGFVTNVNVATNIHFDRKDSLLCVSFALGEWLDGDLVLAGPSGLVYPMRPGHLIVFNSLRIPHFNLLYEGIRMSFVVHSDDALKLAQKLPKDYEAMGWYMF